MAKRQSIQRKQWRWGIALCLMTMIAVAGLGIYRYLTVEISVRPIFSDIVPRQVTIDGRNNVPWPSYGQAAIAHSVLGVVESHGETSPQPTASTAKVITMLAVMQKKPFGVGKSGAMLTITEADVKSYSDYIARNGSNVPVRVGQKITQYEAMQAVLLASSNNHADTLAIWAFGSLEGYRRYATEMVHSWGLTDTTIGDDASGLSPTTTSTAHDLAVIGLKALEQPVIADIIQQSSATLPGGTIHNTNYLLGNDGVLGIKTGETVEAGGVFILGGSHSSGGVTSKIVVTVMGADLSPTAQYDSYRLFQVAKKKIRYIEVVQKGQQVGHYSPWWQETDIPIVTSSNGGVFVWADSKLSIVTQGVSWHGKLDESAAGSLRIISLGQTETVPLEVGGPMTSPSLLQRILGGR